MKIINNPPKKEWNALLQRPTQTVDDIESTVTQIFEDVQRNKDIAISKYTQLFDGVSLENIIVSVEEINMAIAEVSDALKVAIQQAKSNIEVFHAAQKTDKVVIETSPGVTCWQEKRPIQKVGLYIPGGTAPLFSTVLMLAVPAQIAGCKEIVLCSPPNREGQDCKCSNFICCYNSVAVTKIIKVGGIQAIAGIDIWYRNHSSGI